MNYVLIAPFGFAVAIAMALFAYFWRFAQIAVRSEVRVRRSRPSSH